MAIKIEHATASGFCDGVRRAVDLAEEALRSGKVLWADGPLVHNTQMVNALHEEGMEHISDICQLPHGATFIVRAHGISPAKWQTLQEISKKRDLKLIDATCPCVQRVFQIAEYYASQNFPVVILGERDHPEVEAARAWAGDKGYIVSDYAELRTLFPDHMKSFALLAQTTLPQSFFYAFSEQLRRDFPNCVVLDTICAATRLRQESAVALAKRVDLMLVVGGIHSANSRHLYELCRHENPQTLWIEQACDLPGYQFSIPDGAFRSVGIVAGASTPEWIIEEVETKVMEWEKKQETTDEQTANPEEDQKVESPDEVTELPVSESECTEVESEQGAETEDEDDEAVEPEELPTVEDDEETDEIAESEENPIECDEANDDAVETTPGTDFADDASDDSSEGALEAALEMGAFDLPRHSFGDIIKATVVKIQSDEVMVDVGLKSEGVIPRRELSFDSSLTADEVVSVGEEIEVFVLRSEDQEGRMTFSKRRADQAKHWESVLLSFENEEIIEGKITETTKGGLLVDIGVQGFMPASQAERRFTNDLKHLVGQTVRLKLLEVDREKRRAIVSRKAVLDLEAEVARLAFWDRVSEGDIIKGVIRRLTDFGAFVDLGGVDGLLHISDMAYHRVNRPSDIVAIGEEIELKILKMNPDTSKVSLGLKQMQPKPWDALSQELQQGDIIEGTVVRITPWGAFVNVRPGIDGLIHISELDNQRVDKVDDIVHIGEIVQVAVLAINAEKERLSLSLKALKPAYDPEDAYADYLVADSDEDVIEEIIERIEDEVDLANPVQTSEALDEDADELAPDEESTSEEPCDSSCDDEADEVEAEETEQVEDEDEEVEDPEE